MIIDLLEGFYRREADKANAQPKNVFRASSAGYCIRRLAYDKLGFKGDPIYPRRWAVLKHGNMIDAAMKSDLGVTLGDRFVADFGDTYCILEGQRIDYHIDGGFQTETGEIGIIEVKSMADRSFERAVKGEIDRTYLCQAWVYQYGTSFNPVVFLCYRKETSHYVEVIFDRNAKETVVTQRFGGNTDEIALNDPMLLAEVRTPFDLSVEQEVRAKYRFLSMLNSEQDLPEGVRAIEDETVKVQGKAKAEEFKAQYGEATQKGSWYEFKTGRMICGWPCNYCPHVRHCLNAQLEVKDGKPKWIVPIAS